MANEANLFEFKNDKLQISYSSSSFAGVPLFTYKEGSISISTPRFRTDETALGTVVTMTTEVAPDAFVRDVSLIVPHVHLGKNSEADAETLVIYSNTESSFGGPALVQGQVTTYRAISVKGKARHVVF